MKIYFSKIILTLLLALPFSNNVIAVDIVSSEYKVKSALLFKLTRFAEWPALTLHSLDEFTICILGRDDFGESLKSLEGRLTGGVPIKVESFDQSRSLYGRCQMVFISDSKKSSLPEISKNLKSSAILTVGDFSGFAEAGGMIELGSVKGRLNLSINLNETKAAGIKISSLLLELASIVETQAGYK